MSVEIDKYAISIPQDTYMGDQDGFLDSMNELIATGKKDIYVDCLELQSISSSHVSLLWKAMQLCKDNNIEFILTNVNKSIIEVLEILDIKEFFLIEPGENRQEEFLDTNKIPDFTIEPLTRSFIPTVENIIKEKYTVGTHLSDTPVFKQKIFEVQTIFYEVVTNIRLHSDIKPSVPIEYSVSQMNDMLVLRFVDSGIEFDPTEHKKEYSATKAIKDRMKNGLGILMIKKMSDMVTYKRENNNNILTITKLWSKQHGK